MSSHVHFSCTGNIFIWKCLFFKGNVYVITLMKLICNLTQVDTIRSSNFEQIHSSVRRNFWETYPALFIPICCNIPWQMAKHCQPAQKSAQKFASKYVVCPTVRKTGHIPGRDCSQSGPIIYRCLSLYALSSSQTRGLFFLLGSLFIRNAWHTDQRTSCWRSAV